MKPFFSVVIPALNEELFIQNLLSDLNKQTSNNFETIIVDGCSEDQTKKVVLESRLKNKRIFQTPKRNVSYQRNYGAGKSHGKYLVFIDADSRVSKNFIKYLYDEVQKKKGLLFIPYIVPDESSPQIKAMFQLVNFLVERSQFLNKPFSSGGSIIVDRQFFLKIGGFDERLYLAEDHNFIRSARQWGVRAKFLPKIKIKFSLRRMRKEGELTVIYKYLLATIHLLLKGDIKNKLFDYQMGGKFYDIDNKKKNLFLNGALKKQIKQLKNLFRKNLSFD